MKISKYTLVGGGACPEQYDVFLGQTEIGYLRLRHGRFTAEVPFGGEIVYIGRPFGDGSFRNDEREEYLNKAVAAINKYLFPDLLDNLENIDENTLEQIYLQKINKAP